jgi:hypothetical protein
MTTTIWRGDQAGFFQTTTITVTGTWATSDTASLTINGKTLTVTVGSATTTSDIAEILGRMVNGSALKGNETRNATGDLFGEWSGITASYSSAVLTLTADSSGVPFTVTRSENTAGDGALGAPSTTVTPQGPNELAATNLSGGSLTPTNNTLVFQNSSVSCQYGLDQSSAGTWSEVDIDSTFTGYVGLPLIHSASPTDYYEYLERYLRVNATKVVVGAGSGNGSSRILLDLGSVQSAIYVHGTATSSDTGYSALKLKGTHASNTLYADGGTTDIAPYGGETAVINTATVAGSAYVRFFSGCTLGTLEVLGSGVVEIDSLAANTDITTITIRDSADVTVTGTNDITTVYVYSGMFRPLGTFTVTNVKVGAGGKIDTDGSTGTVTFTNTELEAKAQILDSGSHLVFTNAIDLGLGGLEDVTLKLGKGINVLPS